MADVQNLVTFNGTNGEYSLYGNLIADSQGNLYGTTYSGGVNNLGTVFELAYDSASGRYASTPTTLVSFNITNGTFPYAGLIRDASGNLYGTTYGGGANNLGTVFELVYDSAAGRYAGTPTTLVSFNTTNGRNPYAGLIRDASGNLYGTTYTGGANNLGTVFELAYDSASGRYASTPTTLVSFNNTNGQYPAAGLIRDTSGNLYGTTYQGGATNNGSVFTVAYNSTSGSYANTPTTLVSFNIANGKAPYASLIRDASGNLYGTTYGGGANNLGTVFEVAFNSASGSYANTPTTLVSFNTANGKNPYAGLIRDGSGNLYGTTYSGGANSAGTVFAIAYDSTSGSYANTPTTLVSFNTTNGSAPRSGLIADGQGNLYGTTYLGAASSRGTVYTVTGSGFVPVCFATGTRIRTERGDLAVETLAVGDIAITRDGRRTPIRWIGRRHVRCDRHAEPRTVWPVRVRADSFGEGLPYADLWLSRNHALCLDDALVPVRGLIDGERIAQVEQDEVTYWHVELDGHDVILANGLPAESYLDTGNRRGFENAAEVMGVGPTTLHFDEAPAPGYDGTGYCLPMIESGPRLSAIRARYGLGIAAAASTRAPPACPVHLVADDTVLAPVLAGENEIRFVIPAGACEVRLVSPSFAAAGADIRRLGVIVGGLALSDGSGWRSVGLDDPGLYAGFHRIEGDARKAWRWTDGEAHLSPSLWAGLEGALLLRVTGMFAGLAPAEPVDDHIDRRAA